MSEQMSLISMTGMVEADLVRSYVPAPGPALPARFRLTISSRLAGRRRHDDRGHMHPESLHPLTRPARKREHPAWLRGIYAGVFLYFFLCAINVMTGGLKMMVKAPPTSEWVDGLMGLATNPFAALMAGVIVTAIVQSSSFTTTLIITMAAARIMPVETAVFAVMGANIGTSVTGILVSMANVRIRRQFRRAFTA